MLKVWNKAKKNKFFFTKSYIKSINHYQNFVNKYIEKNTFKQKNKLKVLFGSSFSIYPQSFIIDKSLSYLLRIKGADLYSLYCDGSQYRECNVSGGLWHKRPFEDVCKNCQYCSESLWKNNSTHIYKFSDFLDNDTIFKIDKKLSLFENNILELERYKSDNIRIGKFAKIIIANNYLVSDPSTLANYKCLLITHIKNLLISKHVYEQILKKIKPDRVISNDSFYGFWKILEILCNRKKIPFYSHWPITSSSVIFSMNNAAMNLSMMAKWKIFWKKNKNEYLKININTIDNSQSSILKLSDSQVINSFNMDEFLKKIKYTINPTFLLATNASWDLASQDKYTIFDNFSEFICEIILWFKDNPTINLIIKPHPVEMHPKIPPTNETVDSVIKKNFSILPKNVFVCPSTIPINGIDLIKQLDINGLIVHTTTFGIEAAAEGYPVIVTGNCFYDKVGFTINTFNKKKFFNSILNLRKKTKLDKFSMSKAIAFLFFFRRIHSISLDLYDDNIDNPAIKKNYLDALILSKPLNTISDSIINGEDNFYEI